MTRVETALSELERYLNEEIDPRSASDAVAMLMAQPPDVVMQRVSDWSVERHKSQSVPVSDGLFHALKKIFMTGELRLLDRTAVADYLDRVMTIALRICPQEDRDQLRSSLVSMRASRQLDDQPLTRLPTLAGAIPVPIPAELQAEKRISLIVDRLTREMQSAGPGGGQPEPEALSQLLTLAATRSHTGQEFNEYLERLRPLTGGKEGNVFVILGGGMPSWEIPGVGHQEQRLPAQVGAMEKILEIAEDPAVALKRVRELVAAAIAKFNEGALAASVWMLDVAEDSIKERKLDATAIDRIRTEAADAISLVQLRKYTENKGRHAALRLVFGFFPTLRLDTLFRQLRPEKKAERRRALLAFIEAYGASGREAALSELEKELRQQPVDTYFLRNLIFLLHRIPRESDETLPREMAALTATSARGQFIFVIREAVTGLGQIKSEAAAKLLTMRLAEFEALLVRGDTTTYSADDLQKLLDRIVSSLARTETSAALLTIARHGMKENVLLGDTRARLDALAQHDLSFDEQTVNVLLKALRSEIPGKIFGRLLPRRQEPTLHLIEALSGTRTAATEEMFHDLAHRFADQEVGRAAAQVLEKWEPARQPVSGDGVATLTGELEFFGLPSVLQSLAEMRATGMLTLRTREGRANAGVAVLDGKFLNAQCGHIKGADALYEMLERPLTGTFAFVPHPHEKMKSTLPPRETVHLLLEGVRRHDELQMLQAVVPDALTLSAGGTKPARHEDEDDPGLVREVWLKAVSGLPVRDVERQVATDSFRVRRLIAHWVEHGSLVAK
ncbi:MAG TPA: DUF4388 domain-containing protein [Thermoanaerobaculia bacterium]